MRKRRIILGSVGLLTLAAIVTVMWSVLQWPPPSLILTYGFPPAGGPTGRKETVEGVEFVELAPGYFFADICAPRCRDGDFIGQLSARLGLDFGRQPWHVTDCMQGWHEVSETVWVSPHVQPLEVHLRINDDAHYWDPRKPGTQHTDDVRIRSATVTESAFLVWHLEDAGPVVSTWLSGRFPSADRLVWIPPEGED